MNQYLDDEIVNLTATMSSTHLSDTQKELDQLKNMVEALTKRLEGQALPTSPTKPVLPKPQIFDGNRESFPGWKRFMKSKIERDIPHLGRDRVEYIAAFTTGDPSIHIHNFLALGANAACSYLDVLEHMEKRYADPHAKEKARDKLNHLAMKGQDFEIFITEFESLAGKAEIDLWPDDARSEMLERKLSRELRQLLVPVLTNTIDLKKDYHTFVDTVRRTNNNFIAAREDGAYRTGLLGNLHSTQKKPTPETTVRDPDEMDWTTSYKHDTRRTAKIISEEEFQARKSRGRCTTCGNEGHFARRCGYKVSKNQPRFASAPRTFTTRASLPQEVMVMEAEKEQP